MSFGVKDVEQGNNKKSDNSANSDNSTNSDDSNNSGGDSMTFTTGQSSTQPKAKKNYIVAIIAVPSKAMSQDERQQLQDEIRRDIRIVPHIQIRNSDKAFTSLRQQDDPSCVREPLCLSTVGQQAGVDRILLGRVEKHANGYMLDLDYFDVANNLFLKYKTTRGLSSFSNVLHTVMPSIKDMFDIRAPRKKIHYVSENSRGVQKVLAYTTAGLAIVSLGAGIYFGTHVGSQQSALVGSAKNSSGVYTQLTQVQAQQRIRDLQGQAVTANVFYGLSVGLGITSALLFYIQTGSDVGDTNSSDDGGPIGENDVWHRLHLAPSVTAHGLGVGALLNF